MTLIRDADLDRSLVSPAFARDPYPTLRHLRETDPSTGATRSAVGC